jgi:hypothetical protein
MSGKPFARKEEKKKTKPRRRDYAVGQVRPNQVPESPPGPKLRRRDHPESLVYLQDVERWLGGTIRELETVNAMPKEDQAAKLREIEEKIASQAAAFKRTEPEDRGLADVLIEPGSGVQAALDRITNARAAYQRAVDLVAPHSVGDVLVSRVAEEVYPVDDRIADEFRRATAERNTLDRGVRQLALEATIAEEKKNRALEAEAKQRLIANEAQTRAAALADRVAKLAAEVAKGKGDRDIDLSVARAERDNANQERNQALSKLDAAVARATQAQREAERLQASLLAAEEQRQNEREKLQEELQATRARNDELEHRQTADVLEAKRAALEAAKQAAEAKDELDEFKRAAVPEFQSVVGQRDLAIQKLTAAEQKAAERERLLQQQRQADQAEYTRGRQELEQKLRQVTQAARAAEEEKANTELALKQAQDRVAELKRRAEEGVNTRGLPQQRAQADETVKKLKAARKKAAETAARANRQAEEIGRQFEEYQEGVRQAAATAAQAISRFVEIAGAAARPLRGAENDARRVEGVPARRPAHSASRPAREDPNYAVLDSTGERVPFGISVAEQIRAAAEDVRTEAGGNDGRPVLAPRAEKKRARRGKPAGRAEENAREIDADAEPVVAPPDPGGMVYTLATDGKQRRPFVPPCENNSFPSSLLCPAPRPSCSGIMIVMHHRLRHPATEPVDGEPETSCQAVGPAPGTARKPRDAAAYRTSCVGFLPTSRVVTMPCSFSTASGSARLNKRLKSGLPRRSARTRLCGNSSSRENAKPTMPGFWVLPIPRLRDGCSNRSHLLHHLSSRRPRSQHGKIRLTRSQ